MRGLAMPHPAATRQLKRRLGAIVDTSREGCWAASFDSSKISFLPEAVVTPRKEADIGTVLELANRSRVPVTVRGRGTTLMGSAAPVRGGWVIDLTRLNRVTIDAEARTAVIQRAAEARGWFYPPDPSSREYCTIGGNVACNAGGMHGGKYGVTRDFVIALRGFLPTGEAVQWGTATKKFSAGFNLREDQIAEEVQFLLDFILGHYETFGLTAKLKFATRPEHALATVAACAELGIKHVWTHRGPGPGSVSPSAATYGRAHGITVTDGGRPLMFDPTADLAHKCMKAVFTVTRQIPQ